jgi:hypothetical protein
MNIKVANYTPQQSSWLVKLRCPSCRQRGTFDSLGGHDLVVPPRTIAGYRRCPDPSCLALVFFVGDSVNESLVVSYPAERIDFDAVNIPTPVIGALEEAITCHANKCFIASAIMVRKTLEELCRDRGATG